MTGTTLGPYRILEELGRGGMGIVYKAEDTKLERQVALKVLPAAALASQDDRARFYREAKAAAALNHPNIAAIHQIDEAIVVDADGNQIEASDGPRPFIAMEFIEGGTLEDRIEAGPLKLDEAVRIATQVAEALKAAHAKDIVHRDIKSANIMLTQDGQAKVLDFGLAQTSHSTKLTRMGSTLGTVAYMSPEQARGEEVDGRTDLYSLGTVLYEMIAGKLPFGGEYEQAVVYSILNADPEPLTALRTGVPMELERITIKLLTKDAKRRYQTAGDLIADLSGVDVSSPSQTAIRTSTIAPPVHPPSKAPDRRLWMAGVMALLLAAVTYWMGTKQVDLPPPAQMLKMTISTGSVQVLDRPAISNNARYITFLGRDTTTAQTGYFLMDLQEETTRYIRGSENFFWALFSPDNQRLVLSSVIGGSVLRLPSGEPSQFTDQYVDGWYSNLELFVRNRRDGLEVISLDGEPTGLTIEVDTSLGHTGLLSPYRIEDSDIILLQAWKPSSVGYDVLLYEEGADTYSVVQEDGPWLLYWMSSGHLLYGKGEAQTEGHARPFDPTAGKFTGPEYNLDVDLEMTKAGHSATGHLVRVLGTSAWYREHRTFAWMDIATGATELSGAPADLYMRSVLSPDGEHVLSYTTDPGFSTLELISVDLSSGLQTSYGSNQASSGPFWPEESEQFFVVDEESGISTLRGSRAMDQTTESGHSIDGFELGDYRPFAVSDNMARVLGARETDPGQYEVAVFSADSGEITHRVTYETAYPYVHFSPNGRFYAMTILTNTSQRLIVVEVDGGATQVLVETEQQLREPIWSADGESIFYRSYERGGSSTTVHQLNVDLEPGFRYRGSRVVGELPYGEQLIAVDSERNRLLVTMGEDDEVRDPVFSLEVTLNLDSYLNEVAPPIR